MYAGLGCLLDARLLFNKMPLRNLFSWTAILGVYVEHGLFEEAILRFQELLLVGTRLEFFVFPNALKICSGLGDSDLGRQLHGALVKHLFVSNIYVGNALIDMYGKCNRLEDAKKFLDQMPIRDCVSWNSFSTACAANGLVYEALDCLERMSTVDDLVPNLVSWSTVISGFSQNGYDELAIELLFRMLAAGVAPNARTLASVLPACARSQRLSLGKEIHCYVMRNGYMTNSFVLNGLVDMYRRCYDMERAYRIFSELPVKNVFSFNTMIVGYCDTGEISKAQNLFDRMEVMGMTKDIISWNSIISGYVNNFLFDNALNMFRDLVIEGGEADSFTLGSVIVACRESGFWEWGKMIHSCAVVRGLQSNPFVGGALVEMYCACQDPRAAHTAFNEVIGRDITTWNALLLGYARCNQIDDIHDLLEATRRDGHCPNVYTWNGIIAGHMENGHHELALQLFREMQASNLKPDIYTVAMILLACIRLSTIERGKQVHAHAVRCGQDTDVWIGTALVDMYAECGSVEHVAVLYDRISNPNLVSRNAVLRAYALHGNGNEGIDLFCKMVETGVVLDGVTFLSALSSCVHAGSVETGRWVFELMGKYDLKPSIKHYTCMIDLLSRAGRFNEAVEVMEKMPMEPDSVAWGALLGGCVVHGDIGLGEIAGKRLLELEPDGAGNHVLVANLYASAGRWCDMRRTRLMIKDKGMQKSPGCSWIEDGDGTHVFLAGDRSHRRVEEIHETLNHLHKHMKKSVPY